MKRILSLVLVLLLASSAFARVRFELVDFSATEFRNLDKVEALCSGSEPSSFWCSERDAELTLIPTKGADYFFNDAGELLALYGKQQKGQDFNGNYNLDGGQNLIPYAAEVPAGAILIDGEYREPEDPTGLWQRLNENEYIGEFSYTAGDFAVQKTIVVSHIEHTLSVDVLVTRLVPGDEPVEVQYAVPGIARVSDPVVKIGQGESFSLNPLSQPVERANYLSIQNNNRNTAYALILKPKTEADNLTGLYLPPNIIALQKPLPPEEGADVAFGLFLYGGNNELVRYSQEGYLDLPGLFSPNILGRLSLGLLAVLSAIHGVVGSWGLSIIVLTLLFRILVWPLIATQTRSMVGMQQLQPKLQALQKKHKNDREKLTQETMKLYQEAGVNPAGGCLPILVQMPLFIILWRVFANFEFNEGFLWIPDLGLADPFYILPILYVGVMAAQSFLAAKGNPQSLRQQLLINVVFVFFVINFPAGVTLYWVVSMLVQVFQYYLINRSVPAPAKAA